MNPYEKILGERFSKDSLMALATIDENGNPWVRTIDAIYEKGSFYLITFALSNKMKQINHHPVVGISGEWFSGHGLAENLGHILLESNREMTQKLRIAFASWYESGHINEEDPNTILLRIRLIDGTIFNHGEKIIFTVDGSNLGH